MTSRRLAIEALVRVENGAYSNVVVPSMLRSSELDARDRAFVTELVYGTLRQQRALDFLLGQVVDRPPASLDAPVRAALRVGVYQLTHDVPAHAAVSETVAVAPKRARGYVNAVLRRLVESAPRWPDGDDAKAIGVRLSYPDWIVEHLADVFGPDDATATLAAGNQAPPVTLRVNSLRTTTAAVADELRASGADVAPGRLVDGALRVRGGGDPARIGAIAEGRATPEDEASQAVVALLDPRPGETVLDSAAAPGGKATAIGERVGPDGGVVAGDVHPGRVRLIAAAALRLDLSWVAPVVADGRRLPVPRGRADRVLVDAPCSGLGVLRRRPEARWRIRPEHVPRLARLQIELLRGAAGALRHGGVLVYSVCTLTTEETLGVDQWAARELPHLVAEPRPGPPWRRWGRGGLILPHDAGTDGMFVLRLRHT